MFRWLFSIGTILTMSVVTAGAAPVDAATAAGTPQQYYMAVGDSVSFGFQVARITAEAEATGTVNPAHFNTTFVEDFYRMLQTVDPGIQEVNLACPGETTTTAINGGCLYPYPLHTGYTGSQLQAALAFLKAHPGQVSPITVQLGPNDINQLIGKCGGLQATACVASGLPATLKTLGTNLGQIVGALRQAAPTANIIVLNSYNPYAAADPTTDLIATTGSKVVQQVAAATGSTFADIFTALNGTDPTTEKARICVYTAFCTAIHDIHPSDAGSAAIAMAVWNASGYAPLLPGFMTAWASGLPGQGNVLFGTSCNGLVETATRDVGPTANVHIVPVTGNDLPGIVGNIGVPPGTYAYTFSTSGMSGTETDTNGGSCYTTTVAGPAS